MKELVEEFEKKYGELRWQELGEEEKEFSQELLREFIAKMKEIQGEAKAALEKAQEEMRKYADRKRV